MIKAISILSLLLVITVLNCKGQDQVERDIKALHNIVDGFLQKTDDYCVGRKSEVILMILEMDSIGAVREIHLLADNKNIDSSYLILATMKSTDFGDVKFISWKNKTVNLIVYSLSSVGYVDKSVINFQSIVQRRQAVMVRPLYYGVLKPTKETTP